MTPVRLSASLRALIIELIYRQRGDHRWSAVIETQRQLRRRLARGATEEQLALELQQRIDHAPR